MRPRLNVHGRCENGKKNFHRQNEVLHFISIDINSKTQKLLDL